MKKGDRVQFSQHALCTLSRATPDRKGTIVTTPQPNFNCRCVQWDGTKRSSAEYIHKDYLQEIPQ